MLAEVAAGLAASVPCAGVISIGLAAVSGAHCAARKRGLIMPGLRDELSFLPDPVSEEGHLHALSL